ncbi:MAG: hypothetical protein AAF518_29150, partial [Spirochaetota bacterium]
MTPYFNSDYQQFQDKTVCELAWVIASPSLLHHPFKLPVGGQEADDRRIRFYSQRKCNRKSIPFRGSCKVLYT